MTQKEIVDFLESCNFATRTPTEKFLELKEEYDTIVAPRRKMVSELGLLDSSEEFKTIVIQKEIEFSRKITLAGERQAYFFTQKLVSSQGEKITKRLNFESEIDCPFDYCVKYSQIPDEFRKQLKERSFEYYRAGKEARKDIRSNKKFLEFAFRASFMSNEKGACYILGDKEYYVVQNDIKYCYDYSVDYLMNFYPETWFAYFGNVLIAFTYYYKYMYYTYIRL